MQKHHIQYLNQALALAKQRRGFCAPNPSVGAVVVKDGNVLATGLHWAAGHPHAERAALMDIQKKVKDATIYVTLEPCCHWGKTPPCTDIIIESGIKHVIYSSQDPNPTVAGKTAKILEAAGIICEQIPLPEIEEFYSSYRYWMECRLPWITAKLAISLDGKIAGAHGKPVALTGPELNQFTHECRRQSDAILTGINTIINDNPRLNVRLDGEIIKKPIYILDSELRLPLTANVLNTASKITVFHSLKVSEGKKKKLGEKNIVCVPIKPAKSGLDLKEIVMKIGEDGVHDLWVEGGGSIFQSFAMERLANRALIYISPKILGTKALPGFTEAMSILDAEHVSWWSCGSDVVCDYVYRPY